MSAPGAGRGDASAFSLDVDRDHIGWIVFDQPGAGVNLLTTASMREFDHLLSQLESRIATGKLVAVVLWSGKPGQFIAGADVKEIASLKDEDDAFAKSREGQRILRRLERLRVPTFAAVDGTCVGGGAELILACAHRVASDREGTRIGFPEVKLGILPGFGGTVRLPRLCGPRRALDLLLTGRSIPASRARRIGLLDAVLPYDRFREELRRFISDTVRKRRGREPIARSLIDRLLEDSGPGRKALFAITRRRVARETRGRYPAPPRIVDVVERTAGMALDPALEIEARALAELAVTEVSRNLVRVFLLSQRARRAIPAERREEGRTVERAAVIGAGVMGGAIAELIASRDIPVLLKDIDREALDRGLRHANDLLTRAASKGVFAKDQAGLKFALISGTLEYDGFEDVDLAVEAVVERLPVKQQVLRDFEERVDAEAVFATNTSSLSVGAIAGAGTHPERVVGLHFFNPVHRMPLVEVVRPADASERAVATAFGFALDLGKTPVLVSDSPGFLVNRLLAPYLNEAGHLVGEGVPVAGIDAALEEFGMPMGPCRLLDEIGFDVAGHASRELARAFGDRMAPAAALERLREDGRLGKKNGRGFYAYRDGRAHGVDPAVNRLFSRSGAEGGTGSGAGSGTGSGAAYEAAEIRRRCLYPMVNEAAWALEARVVDSADLVDLATITGTGFPPFRGGLLRWADDEGLADIVAALVRFGDALGPRFSPAPLLTSLAERGRTFTRSA